MSENLYRVFHKGLNGVRKLYPANDPEQFVLKAIEIMDKDPNSDYYESIYSYQDEHKEILKQTKSLAGINNVRIDRIVLDFDAIDLNDAKNDAQIALNRLRQYFASPQIRIFFSGGKGFHLEVHLDEFIDRSKFEDIIYGLAGDLKTFDTKVKDHQRLFRFPLTRNLKTKQFKIPLEIKQFEDMTIEEIQELSKKQDHTDFYTILNNYFTASLPDDLRNMKRKDSPKEKVEPVSLSERPDMSKKPKYLTPAKYALQQGYFEEGERNEACMILASTYKYLNEGPDHTYNIIKATLRLRAGRLDLGELSQSDREELWRTIIVPVFSPTWKGGTFSEEDGLLKRTIDRYNLDKVNLSEVSLVDLSSLSAQFMDFATNIDANTIKLGIDEIDSKLRITTSSLVAFLAAPSAGKSSVSFGILNTVSKTDEKAIFFSMDMSIPQVFQRLIQRHTGHNEDKIMDNYKNNVRLEVERYQEVLNDEYKNVKFCFRSGMSAEEVRATILHHQQSSGVMPRLVILDYLECMRAEGISDSTQSKAQISTALKGIANELGICIILLVQPRMMAGGPAGELNSYTDIKGSSVISEAAAQVITMSRPGFSPKNPEDDNYVTINVVKNRMGKLSSTDLHWDGLTGHIRSLNTEEQKDLSALRGAIAAEKAEDKKGPGGDLY